MNTTDFDYVRRIVLERSSIVLDGSKAYLAEARLLPVARQLGLGSIADLVARLRIERGRELQTKVVEAMTTNETSFFRDRTPFEALRLHVLPRLVTARAKLQALRIWSAGCSTGQEPYSIAMMLRDYFTRLDDWDVSILATDLSHDVLGRARAGRYSQLEVNRGMPAEMLIGHFDRDGIAYQLRDDVRRMVDFRQLNLADPWPDLPRMDVVFLRNVLIYFDVPVRRAILQRVRRVLAPDGFLFLGGAETTLNLDDSFERVAIDKAGCYRLAGRTA